LLGPFASLKPESPKYTDCDCPLVVVDQPKSSSPDPKMLQSKIVLNVVYNNPPSHVEDNVENRGTSDIPDEVLFTPVQQPKKLEQEIVQSSMKELGNSQVPSDSDDDGFDQSFEYNKSPRDFHIPRSHIGSPSHTPFPHLYKLSLSLQFHTSIAIVITKVLYITFTKLY
jgi:hypothetical protein